MLETCWYVERVLIGAISTHGIVYRVLMYDCKPSSHHHHHRHLHLHCLCMIQHLIEALYSVNQLHILHCSVANFVDLMLAISCWLFRSYYVCSTFS